VGRTAPFGDEQRLGRGCINLCVIFRGSRYHNIWEPLQHHSILDTQNERDVSEWHGTQLIIWIINVKRGHRRKSELWFCDFDFCTSSRSFFLGHVHKVSNVLIPLWEIVSVVQQSNYFYFHLHRFHSNQRDWKWSKRVDVSQSSKYTSGLWIAEALPHLLIPLHSFVLIPTSVKYRTFQPSQTTVYLACDMCWNFIWPTQSRHISRNFFLHRQ
jgi:hypothetical protein